LEKNASTYIPVNHHKKHHNHHQSSRPTEPNFRKRNLLLHRTGIEVGEDGKTNREPPPLPF
jgi:hypothetical protein